MTGKERLIELLKLLYTVTDEDHKLSTAEIVTHFAEQGVPTDRSTVKADIDVLNNCGIEIPLQKLPSCGITSPTGSSSLRS